MDKKSPTLPIKLVKYEIPESAMTYKPAAPFSAIVVSNDRLTDEGTNVDIRNVVFDISESGIRYIEGQSIGIIPPGLQEDGRPHRVRLYSIASSRTGDDGSSTTVTLCVKRVLFTDENGKEVKGVSSNYICDLLPGEPVNLIGPAGRTFFLPQDDSVNLIMVAAGTGIAPFRAFIHRIYREKKTWNGKVRLFYGVRNAFESAYMNQQNADIGQYMSNDTFEAFQAFSQSEDKSKVYVQHHVAEQRDELFQIIDEGNFSFYLCGMKAMEKSVEEVFRAHAIEIGRDWDEMKGRFKAEGRWNVETY